MPIISARLLRQSLNKIESLSDINEVDKIPFNIDMIKILEILLIVN